TGVRDELDKLFTNIARGKKSIQTYSKSAFTQYRQKLEVASLVYLMNKHLEYFNKNAAHKQLWHGYRLVAIDGSSLNLPEQDCLREQYGVSKNQSGTDSATARISVAYDVMNKLVLDARIDNMQTGEISMAKAHLSQLNPSTDLLVFDRGYPSID